MENIEKLNKEELINLQLQINERLKNLNEVRVDKVIKPKKKLKNKLSYLLKGDKILGIGLSLNDNDVYFTDYCVIKADVSNNTDSDYLDFRVSHGTYPFIYTNIHKDYINKHYYMFISCSIIYFFTLKPNTWEKDLQEALIDKIKIKKEYYDKEIKDLGDNINTIISNKIKIDENIKKNKKNISF